MKFVGLLSLFIFTCTIALGQRTDFSLRNTAPIHLNPANTGTLDKARINYLIAVPPLSFSGNNLVNYLSYDQHFSRLHGGIGIEYESVLNNTRTLTENNFGLNYAFQQNIGKKLTLSVGIGLTLKREKINFNKLTFPCTIHGTPKVDEDGFSRKLFVQPKLGVSVYGEKFFSGVHYTQNRQSDICLVESHRSDYFMGYLGYSITPFQNKNLSFIPSIHYSNENQFQQLGFQTVFNTGRFSVGASYYARNRISIVAGVYFWNLRLKYSYSINNSLLTNAAGAGSEFSIQFDFPNAINRNSRALTLNLF